MQVEYSIFLKGEQIMDIDNFFLLFMRGFLAAIFITSSLPKLRHPHTFTSAVAAYRLLPQPWIRPFAITLPWLELALGLLLLVGWQTQSAALVSAALFFLFLAAMGLNLARGRKDLACGCSGKQHAQKIGWKTITRNVVLILLALPLAVWGGGFLALDNPSPAVQAFILETLLLHTLLPLALSVGGLLLLFRLLRQTVRLVLLTPVDNQLVEAAENFGNLPTIQVEGQK
jgi:uncharacterized membrane protein YphA (DoxX/SURF4 family)